MSRRQAIQAIPLVVFGLAAACSAPTVSTPDTSPSQSPQPANTNKPKKEAVPTLDPIEGSIRENVMSYWTSLIAGVRQGNGSNPTELMMGIYNPNVWNMDRFLQIAKTGTHPIDEPLKLQWFAIKRYASNAADKWIGKMEINNIKIKTIGTPATSDADKANGIKWAGGVQLDFISRTSSWFETTPFGGYPSVDKVSAWLKSQQPLKEFLPFSPWSPDGWGVLVTEVQKGTAMNPNFRQSGFMQGLDVPSQFLNEPCSGGDTSYCQRVILK